MQGHSIFVYSNTFVFSPAWLSQDLSSVSQAPIVPLQEGRDNKSCHTEIATWSNSEDMIYHPSYAQVKQL